ncbi:MAG: type I restriction enzyme HsdR N-terminal domain-containing protein [Betaproteobacteria bacterium]
MEDEFVTREKKILSILEQEIMDGEEMAAAVRHIAERLLLGEKGYSQADIRKNFMFEVALDAETVTSFVDFLVSAGDRNAMVIKCAAGSLSSRERHVVAAARVLGSLPVPVAVVMDPMSAVVLDATTGKVLAEGFEAIPTKQQLSAIMAARELKPIAPEKREREKRVLLAFDAIRCSIPHGADGGVAIGDKVPAR